MGNRLAILLVLGFAILFILVGTFGPSGVIQNRELGDKIALMRRKIGQEHAENDVTLNSGLEQKKQPQGVAINDKILSGGSKIAAATAMALVLFLLFAAIDRNRTTYKGGKKYQCPVFDISTKKGLEKIIKTLEDDKLVIIPCDTIYGICARANAPNAQKIIELKRRDSQKGLITLCSKSSAEEILADNCPKAVLDIWPAPLSVISKNKDGSTVCIRVPNDKTLQKIIARTGSIFSTSANISGEKSLNDLDAIADAFCGRVDAIGYDDAKDYRLENLPSSILDVTAYPFRIVRNGAVSATDIEEKLNKNGLCVSFEDVNHDAS